MTMPENHAKEDNGHRYVQRDEQFIHPMAQWLERMDAEEAERDERPAEDECRAEGDALRGKRAVAFVGRILCGILRLV